MAGKSSLLDRVRSRMIAGESIEMANVSTVDRLMQMRDASHNIKRQEAQIDAYLKCRFGDDYEAPEREDDDEMNVYMNNVITDTKTLKHVADAEAGAQKPAVPWWMAALGAAGLAAALTAFLMPKGDDTNTQNTLRPGNPSQIVPP